MAFRIHRRAFAIAAGSLAALGGFTLVAAILSEEDTLALASQLFAQTDAAQNQGTPVVNRAGRVRSTADRHGGAAAAPGKSAPAPAASADGQFQMAEQLQTAGVKRCLGLADGIGRFEMKGVTQYAATSTWNKGDPDKRLFSSLMGQRFGQSAATPIGVSGVVSAPSSDGKCDAMGFQILPTTSTCSAVRAQVLDKGEWLGDMAGVPILRNAQNLRVMLLPTAGDGCVIVGVNNYYSE
jgi:hypothetical protein